MNYQVCDFNLRCLFICIGVLINQVLSIDLNVITENVIKGEPIHLFCHIPKFTNIASFDMPNGLPFRKVVCNNVDVCSINKHGVFKVNSNSSGLTLTLKVLNATIEGEYACTYKREIKTYSLNISTLNIIDPNDGCNIIVADDKYECQTKCLKLKNNQTIQWEFKTDNNETETWNTSASQGDCDCCKDKKQFVSHSNINDKDGMLKCFITLSSDVTLWSPPIRVKSKADGDQSQKTVIIISILFTFLVAIVVLVSFLYIRYKRSKKTKEPHTVSKVRGKLNSNKDKSVVFLTNNVDIDSNEVVPMFIGEEQYIQRKNEGNPMLKVEEKDTQSSNEGKHTIYITVKR